MLMKRGALLMLSCGLIVMLAGCATMISGETQMVMVLSTPPGAFVRVGHQTGNTPVSFNIPKGEHYPVEISQGPDRRLVPLRRSLDPTTLLNLIPPLWPGFIVDAVTGSMTRYEPDVISIDFRTGLATQQTHLTSMPY